MSPGCKQLQSPGEHCTIFFVYLAVFQTYILPCRAFYRYTGMSKVSSSLSSHLQNVPADAEVNVVVELNSSPVPGAFSLSRQEKMQSLREAFSRNVEPVERFIEKAGGRVNDQAWLNQTLNVSLPACCLDQLTQLEEVAAVDIPHVLRRD